MIRSAFSLTEFPFMPPSSLDHLYHSAQVAELLARLERLLQHRGIALLTGETGAGKSTITSVWSQALPANATATYTLSLPAPSPRALLRNLSRQLNLTPAHAFDSLLAQITETLIAVRNQDKRQPVLIVEESQRLAFECLEVLQHLSDLRIDGYPLLAVLLVAQRDLSAVLKQRIATALRQRLLFAYHLTGLQRDEVAHYMNQQLTRAGASRQLFDDAAVAALFNYSQGLPRVINALATDALYLAADQNRTGVDRATVEAVADRREDLA